MATQITLPQWPESLPCPQASGYSYQAKAPFMRTDMDSGRARQRRRFVRTPTMVQATFSMSADQLVFWEAFLHDEILDGAAWFEIPLVNSLGKSRVKARMTDSAPVALVVPNKRWSVTMELETMDLPKPGPVDLFIAGVGRERFLKLSRAYDRAINIVRPGLE